MTFFRVNNTLIDTAKITALFQDEKGEIVVLLDSGERLRFNGMEAAEIWKALDNSDDWRGEQ